MIFWNIKLLKQRLMGEGLSQKHLFVYIFINIILYDFVLAGNYILPSEDLNIKIYDHVASIASFITISLGTYFIYRVNGGSEGKQFAERFFSIYFVVGMRFLVLFILILMPFFFGFWVAEEDALISTWFEVIILAIVQGWLVIFYWRMIVHVKEVASSTPA